jgi:hypothetical protein
MARNHKRHRKRAPGHKVRQPQPRFSIRNWPHGPPPALGTVRSWMRQAEDAGLAERKGVERTGKPGRPAVLWGLTEAGKHRNEGPPEIT